MKPKVVNKRVNGKMRRVQINAKGQWKFLPGKPRSKPKTHKPKHHKSKPNKPKYHKPKSSKRSRGFIWG